MTDPVLNKGFRCTQLLEELLARLNCYLINVSIVVIDLVDVYSLANYVSSIHSEAS